MTREAKAVAAMDAALDAMEGAKALILELERELSIRDEQLAGAMTVGAELSEKLHLANTRTDQLCTALRRIVAGSEDHLEAGGVVVRRMHEIASAAL